MATTEQVAPVTLRKSRLGDRRFPENEQFTPHGAFGVIKGGKRQNGLSEGPRDFLIAPMYLNIKSLPWWCSSKPLAERVSVLK